MSVPRTRWAVNCSKLFTELPLLDRPRAARDAGFTAIEFYWPFEDSVPQDADVDAFTRAVEDSGVQLATLNFAAGNMGAGDRGIASWLGRETEFRDSADVAIAIAERLGTGVLNVVYGRRQPGQDPVAQDEAGVENLRFAASRFPGELSVEPLSALEDYPLKTSADVFAVIDRVGAPRVGLLADLYHLATNGEDLTALIQHHVDRIVHVQVADAPGRHEPGTGSLPVNDIVAALGAAGYTGYVSVELEPVTDDPFSWLPVDQRGGIA